jgi:FtsP/CotA-like multicopper oxidase with cupredoxin domain
MVSRRKLGAVILITWVIVAIAALVTGIVVVPPPESFNAVTPAIITKSTCDRPPGFYLIIADLSGFNNSIGHGAPTNPWPIIRVQQGDVVRILVCNKDTTQPHGFAITTYFPVGVAIAPSEAYRIVFTATMSGTFVMYCNIFCTVHVFMTARLVVQPNT